MKGTSIFLSICIFCVIVISWSCSTSNSDGDEVAFAPTPYIIPDARLFPKELNIPLDNPMTVEGVELGRYLFYDGRLSGNTEKDKLMSCATCHIQENGFEVGLDHPKFQGGRTFGLPTENFPEGKETPHYMLPIVNLVYNHNGYLWNGFISESNVEVGKNNEEYHFKSIESLVWMSITAEHEMNSTVERSVAAISSDPMYKDKFKRAFGTEEINYERISKAIAQFVRSIVSHNSRFH